MSFMTRTDSMLKNVKTYLDCWARPGPDLKEKLSGICAPIGVLYRGDGVLHPNDRVKTVDDLADHITERHAAYKHILHHPFCIAVDENSNNAYLGVRYIQQSVAPVGGSEPTGRPSEGVLLERLEMDDHGNIAAALVCRTLTIEERNSLTVDPSAVHPGPLQDGMLFAKTEQLSPEDIDAMKQNIKSWVTCWDSQNKGVDRLDQILAPDVCQISGYGLGKRAVPFQGLDAAKKAVEGVLSHMDNTNEVLGLAVCSDARAGFVQWQSTALHAGGGSPDITTGLDYLRFDDANRIAFIYNFTMRPYTNIRDNEPARQDKID